LSPEQAGRKSAPASKTKKTELGIKEKRREGLEVKKVIIYLEGWFHKI
jgi:hypothetical protein